MAQPLPLLLGIVMPSSGRNNLVAMICSGLCHAAVVFGVLLPMWTAVAPVARRDHGPPLIVDLIPLDRLGDAVPPPTTDAEQAPARPVAPRHPVADLAVATRRSTSIAPAVVSASVPAPPTSQPDPMTDASSAAISEYQRRLYAIIARNSRYPAAARERHLEGVTRLAFRLTRLGEVVESWIQQSSGSEILDDASLQALDRAQPLPPIPPDLPASLAFAIEIDSSVMRAGQTASLR